MPSTAALELLIALKGDKEAAEGMDDLAEKGGGMGDAIQTGAAIAGGAILAFGGILVGATKAAAEDEAARDRLNQTLKNSIPNWDGNAAAIDTIISSGQKLAFTDDEVRDSLGLLVTRTGDLTEAQNLQATAMDLARAKNISLEQATKLVGKADDESYAALAKLGIKIDEHATKEEALAQIRASSAGQAEAYANSTAGTLARIQDSVGEAFETVGGAILPLVEGPLKAIADWFASPEVQTGITTIATNIGTFLAGAFTTLSTIVAAVWPTVQTVFTFIKDNAGIILTGLALALTAFVIPAFIAWATTMLTVALPALIATMAPIIAAAAPFLALAAAIGLLWLAFENNFMGIRDFVVPIVDAVMLAVSRFWTEMQPKLMEAWNAISSTVVAAWGWIQSTIIDGVVALWTAWETNWGGIQTIVTSAWDTISAIVSTAWTLVSGIISAGLSLLSGDWETAWGTVQTTLSDVWTIITTELLPNALDMIGTLIFDFAPKLLGLLAEWTGAFFGWVWNDIIPKIPGWLGSIISLVWTWISDNAPIWLENLGQWTTALWNWITNDVMPQLPGKIAAIAEGIWTWLTETATSLGDKLVNEWIPAMWEWITGEGGVVATIGEKLKEIWDALSTWIGTTASDILTAVMSIGEGIVQGIQDGISGAWDAFSGWVMDQLGGMLDGIKNFFGISSPSKVMAESIGAPLAAGIGAGFASVWPGVASGIEDAVGNIAGIGATIGIGGGGGGTIAPSLGRGGGGGGINIDIGGITAGLGADGRRIADELIEELEYRLGDQIAIRNGSRGF